MVERQRALSALIVLFAVGTMALSSAGAPDWLWGAYALGIVVCGLLKAVLP